MTRLWTAGFETNDLPGTTGVTNLEAATLRGTATASNVKLTLAGSGAVTIDATVSRTGSRSLKVVNGGSGSSTAGWNAALVPFVSGRTYYIRAYVRIDGLPNLDQYIVMDTGSNVACVLHSDGTLQLVDQTGFIGSATAAITPGDGHWYRIELRMALTLLNVGTCELQIDGVSIAIGSGRTKSVSGISLQPTLGAPLNDRGTSQVYYFDDCGANDSVAGGNQNTWLGAGKVALLLPTSDNSAGSWKAGSAASAASNGALYDALNNTPPVGTATPDAVTAAISNAVSSATAPNGDFNMATYASAGIGGGDTINALTMLVVHGEDVAANTKTGTFAIVSNPAAGPDTIGASNASQFGPSASGAVGAYPTRWIAQMGAPTYLPSVTVGTAPVCRITKSNATTDVADLAFMGLYVDYTPATTSIKTVDGLAKASVKTVMGLAIASVKTMVGLA